jgi:hypothetical protein
MSLTIEYICNLKSLKEANRKFSRRYVTRCHPLPHHSGLQQLMRDHLIYQLTASGTYVPQKHLPAHRSECATCPILTIAQFHGLLTFYFLNCLVLCIYAGVSLISAFITSNKHRWCSGRTLPSHLISEPSGKGRDFKTLTMQSSFAPLGVLLVDCLVSFGLLGFDERRPLES